MTEGMMHYRQVAFRGVPGVETCIGLFSRTEDGIGDDKPTYRYRLAARRKESGGGDSAAVGMPCCTVGHRRIRRGTSGDASYGPQRSVPRTKEVSVSLNLSMEGGSLVAGSA
jgi:hypothetical protein